MDHPRRRITLGALAGAALAYAPATRAAACRYLIEPLADTGVAQVLPQAINASGMVTGSASTSWPGGRYGKAFKGVPQRMKLAPWDGEASTGVGINDLGVVVGQHEQPVNMPAWRWDREGLSPIAVAGAPTLDHAADINNAGLIVGTTLNTDMWLTDGHDIVWLPRLAGQTRVWAGRLSHAGIACGWRLLADGVSDAFVWDGAEATSLQLPFAVQHARDINDAGQVCGDVRSDVNGLPQAFIWDRGRLRLLTGGPDFAVNAAIAHAINRHGVVVGDAKASPKGRKHYGTAFIWKDGVMQDLNVVTGAQAQGWFLATATGINDRGQIVGRGAPTRQGRLLGYVATPVACGP
jgi:probable HAF family extracellular repeat protein